ncbi:hypothetical protein AAFF_G00183040 [Aldrovandia affinis]|uniref:Uncharacterized protein n=1 Tax=Aldrovandia affinis TaxID=143900 RepID=A0AAD7RK82_9TELE|nr:hypothetical protein AAFF_G00183040 [Aldrovandia affinis]
MRCLGTRAIRGTRAARKRKPSPPYAGATLRRSDERRPPPAAAIKRASRGRLGRAANRRILLTVSGAGWMPSSNSTSLPRWLRSRNAQLQAGCPRHLGWEIYSLVPAAAHPRGAGVGDVQLFESGGLTGAVRPSVGPHRSPGGSVQIYAALLEGGGHRRFLAPKLMSQKGSGVGPAANGCANYDCSYQASMHIL